MVLCLSLINSQQEIVIDSCNCMACRICIKCSIVL